MKKRFSLVCCSLLVAVAAWAQDYPVAHGANVNIEHATHYPKTVSIKGTQTPEYKLENIAMAPRCAAYFDKTATVFEVKAGDIVTPAVTIAGAWMHGYVFVDWNDNKQFEVSLLGNGPYTAGEGNELMSYSHYNKTSDGNDGWNSAGGAVGGDVLTLCSFRVPSDLSVGSTYRMRYSVTWNCADPSGNYAKFLSDGGSIIDVTLKIVGKAENVQKYPIDDYDEPIVDAKAPDAEWNALAEGLHLSWADRNTHYEKHRVPQLTESTTASICAWKGERANIEAVLFSNQDQGTLSVRMTPLKNSKTQELTPYNCATARFLNYIITDDGRGCGNHNFSLIPWLVPDVIDQDKPKTINARETRPVWCSIEVPRDIEAGNYTTTMEVVNEQQKVINSLNLTIEVVDHCLPEVADQKFHLDLWQQPYSVSRYYDVERWSPEHVEALRPYLTALGKAGQSVVTTILFYEPWGEQSHDKFSAMVQTTKKKDGTWVFNYDIFDKYVELCNECGINKQINCYSMVTWDMKFRYYDEATGKDIDWALTAGSKDYNALWDAYLKAFRKHLEEKGWFEKTCIAMDERSEAQMLAAYEIIKANGFKMALAGNYHSSLNDKLYDSCVALAQGGRFTPAERQYRKDKGLITTVYTCCTESEPNIYSNSLPAEAAFLPIHIAANDLDGYLHWSWINWDEHPLTDTRFRKFGAGDTYCYYPGNRSSVRFERLVEGIHQYEKVQIMKQEKASDASWMQTLGILLDDCKDYLTTGPECAEKVQRLEDFLNGKEVVVPERMAAYFRIKVDNTHYAKAKANLTQWDTELSSQRTADLFLIEGTPDACTIKLQGRQNNIGPDASKKLFVDQTATTKYAIVEATEGKVKLQNNGYWVYVDKGTFTWNTSKSTELELEYVMPRDIPEGVEQATLTSITQDSKILQNRRLVIVKDGEHYDVTGLRLKTPRDSHEW